MGDREIIRDLEKQLAEKEECLTDQKIETLRTEMKGMESRLTERTDTLEKNIKESIKNGFDKIGEDMLRNNLQHIEYERNFDVINQNHTEFQKDIQKIKRITNPFIWLLDHPKWLLVLLIVLVSLFQSENIGNLVKLIISAIK